MYIILEVIYIIFIGRVDFNKERSTQTEGIVNSWQIYFK